MKITKGLLGLVGILLFAAVPARATHIDVGASRNGQSTSLGTCVSDISGSNTCEAAFETSTTIDGVTIWNFASCCGNLNTLPTSGPPQASEIEVFQLTGITTGAQITLDFQDATQDYGLFLCASGSGNVLDSSSTPQVIGYGGTPIPCTTSGGASSVSFAPPSGDDVTMTFDASGSYTFYTTDGNLLSISPASVATPEPATVLLLGSGLLGLAGMMRRRKTQA